MHDFLLQNAKALIAFLTALATWGGTALADDGISGVEWVGLTGPFIVALGVWLTTNAPTEQQLSELAAWKMSGSEATVLDDAIGLDDLDPPPTA